MTAPASSQGSADDDKRFRRIARQLQDDKRTTLAVAEASLLEDHSSVGRAVRADRLQWGFAIALGFFTVLGATAFMGAPIGMGSDGLSRDQARVLSPICILVGLIGVLWSLRIWLRRGRPHDAWEIGVTSLWFACAVVASGGQFTVVSGIDWGVIVAVIAAVAALVSVVWRLLAMTNALSGVEAQSDRLTKVYSGLPYDEQQRLLAERQSLLDRLLAADVITDSVHRKASQAQWGELWRLR
jgi:hypothetical protein